MVTGSREVNRPIREGRQIPRNEAGVATRTFVFVALGLTALWGTNKMLASSSSNANNPNTDPVGSNTYLNNYAKSIKLVKGARIRFTPDVPNPIDDQDNLITTIKNTVTISGLSGIRVDSRPYAGDDWVGIHVDDLNTVRTHELYKQTLKDKSGEVWINLQKAETN